MTAETEAETREAIDRQRNLRRVALRCADDALKVAMRAYDTAGVLERGLAAATREGEAQS